MEMSQCLNSGCLNQITSKRVRSKCKILMRKKVRAQQFQCKEQSSLCAFSLWCSSISFPLQLQQTPRHHYYTFQLQRLKSVESNKMGCIYFFKWFLHFISFPLDSPMNYLRRIRLLLPRGLCFSF